MQTPVFCQIWLVLLVHVAKLHFAINAEKLCIQLLQLRREQDVPVIGKAD